jgi:RNA polymerase sigma factor (sigma-70 family)
MGDEHPATDEADATAPLTADLVATLVANHRDFLAFVQRRVGERARAEEILQDAFVRSLDKLDTVRDSVVGWFYRVLRNAIIDEQRRRATASRRLEVLDDEHEPATDVELRDVVCRCVSELAGTLKPEYASALRRIELDGVAVKDYAAEAGISVSNAGVRVFRAREALRKQVARSCGTCADHGCLDCTCDRSPSGCS